MLMIQFRLPCHAAARSRIIMRRHRRAPGVVATSTPYGRATRSLPAPSADWTAHASVRMSISTAQQEGVGHSLSRRHRLLEARARQVDNPWAARKTACALDWNAHRGMAFSRPTTAMHALDPLTPCAAGRNAPASRLQP